MARPLLSHKLLALLVAGVALGYAPLAHAALDEVLAANAKDVAATEVAGHALRVRVHDNLKEFAGADGKIFAATWQGKAPDLHSILGAHYAAYVQALHARRPGGHNHLFFSTPELTVNVISHGRFIAGTAYLTQRLPQGVTVDALR